MTKEEEKRKVRRMTAGVLAAAGVILLFVFAPLFHEENAAEPAAGSGGEMVKDSLLPQEDPEDDTEPETDEAEMASLEHAEVPATGENGRITLGIDVSHFQEEIDWKQVADSGIDFAMVRLGCRKSVSGQMVKDDRAEYNLREAAANGIYVGAYFFSTAVSKEEAIEEARWVCELLDGYTVAYPVVYNCEGFEEEYSRQHDMTVAERSEVAEAFLDEIEAAGYTGMFYASAGELQNNRLWDTDQLEKRYLIWVAQYLPDVYPETANPEYGGSYRMWQYTDQGTVPGIHTVVDLNVAYFGYEEIPAEE